MVLAALVTFHEKYVQYDLGEGHPFRGDRFANALGFFNKHRLFDPDKAVLSSPQSASREDLLRVHDEHYVDLVFNLAQGRKKYDAETPVSPEILEAAMLIVGGAIDCGRAVVEGKARLAVSLGGGYHHAGRSYGGGFCLFNDIAVLIEDLKSRYGMKRFLVLDHDVHFGNGTSDIYYADSNVLYVSLHQDPRTLYPGDGFVWQIGEDSGKGYNVNVPLPPRTGDETYQYVLEEVFVPLAEEFKPEIILGNGGSDPHFADTLGDLSLTTKGFFRLGNIVADVAKRICQGKLVLIPGSGYNPEVLPSCWFSLIAGAMGLRDSRIEEKEPVPEEPSSVRRTVEKTLDELKRLLRAHWACFGGYGLNALP